MIEFTVNNRRLGSIVATVDDEDADFAQIKWAIGSRRHPYLHLAGRRAAGVFHVELHRLIMERKLGRKLLPGEYVDHADNDTLNNTRDNLRLSTNSQNTANSKRRSGNKSGFKGVSWHKTTKKWRASITVNGKWIHLGYFDDPKDAHAAYCEAAKVYFGEFANCG